MKILLFIFIITLSLLQAKDKPLTKKDLSDSNRVLIELIKINNDNVNKRFESMQKQVDKRFEDMQKHMDKRFEDMQKYMDKRFEQVDKRFKQVDKRFEDMQKYMDKRFEDMNSRFNILTTIMISGFILIMGYLMKERHISKEVEAEVDDINKKLEKKVDKRVVEKLIEIIEKLARKDSEVQELLKKHNLTFNN